MAYTVKDMQNGTAGIVSELNGVKSKCQEAATNLTAQISNVESSWQGQASDAMVEALSAQKTRIQNAIGRIEALIAEAQSLAASAAAAWPAEEAES